MKYLMGCVRQWPGATDILLLLNYRLFPDEKLFGKQGLVASSCGGRMCVPVSGLKRKTRGIGLCSCFFVDSGIIQQKEGGLTENATCA